MKKHHARAPRKTNETALVLGGGLAAVVLVGGLIYLVSRPTSDRTSPEGMPLTDTSKPVPSVPEADAASTTPKSNQPAPEPAGAPPASPTVNSGPPSTPQSPALVAGSVHTLGPARVELVEVADSAESPVFKKPAKSGTRFAVLTLRVDEFAEGGTLDSGKIFLRNPGGLMITARGGFQIAPKSVVEMGKSIASAMATAPGGPGTYKLADKPAIDLKEDMGVSNGMEMKAGGSMAFANGMNVGFEGPMTWAEKFAWEGTAGVFFEIPVDLDLKTCLLEYE